MRCLAFVWVSLVFLYILYKYIYKYKLLYIAFWAIAACLWVPTLPKRFLFSVWISWWIHSCFCLMKANSCNMQELWPGNKITVHVHPSSCSLATRHLTQVIRASCPSPNLNADVAQKNTLQLTQNGHHLTLKVQFNAKFTLLVFSNNQNVSLAC